MTGKLGSTTGPDLGEQADVHGRPDLAQISAHPGGGGWGRGVAEARPARGRQG
jgi:hypothetical protein